MIRRAWFYEQLALVALLAWAVAAQVTEQLAFGRLGVRAGVLIAASAVIVLAAQKVRSMADRQREANEAYGVGLAPMSCAPRVAVWGAILQALGLFAGMAAAPTNAHVAIAIYVALYPFWRRLYRRLRPRVLYRDEGSVVVRSKSYPTGNERGGGVR